VSPSIDFAIPCTIEGVVAGFMGPGETLSPIIIEHSTGLSRDRASAFLYIKPA
jgi:hypothetical protein